MRDLGGLRTATGRVRSGQLYRAGSFVGLSQQDAAWLVRTKGIGTVVDLRTAREVDRDGRPEALIELGVDWRPVPFGVDGRFLAGRRDRGTLADFLAEYRKLAAVAAAPVREILTAVGEDVAGGVVFSCTLGKDRTGVVACLLLSALGVRPRDIVADYALTARSLRTRSRLVAELADSKNIPTLEVAGRLETRAATMRALLAAIAEDYGGRWFERAGIGADLTDRARTILVESTLDSTRE